MNELRPIGRIVYANDEGILPRIAFPKNLEPWRDVVDRACDLVDSSLRDKAVAVLGRGSIMRGTAVPKRSDLDLVVIYEGLLSPTERSVLKHCEAEVAEASAMVTEVELLPIPEQEFMVAARWEWMRFTLAHQGLTLRGKDFLPLLPPPKLDERAIAHDRPQARWRMEWRRHWADATNLDERQKVCAWVMKRHVRAAFERIMFDLNGYTRDLHPAASAIADRYPEHAETLWKACRLAIFPVGDLHVVDDVANAMNAVFGNDPVRQ